MGRGRKRDGPGEGWWGGVCVCVGGGVGASRKSGAREVGREGEGGGKGRLTQ